MQEKPQSNQKPESSNSEQEQVPGTPEGLNASLSAMLDDEAQELELRRVLRASAQDPELSATWQRYQLVRDTLEGAAPCDPRVNLLEGIHAELGDELPGGESRQPWRHSVVKLGRRLGQVGVAASVAFTVLYGASSLQVALQQDAEGGSMVAEAGLPALGGDYNSPASLTRTVSMDAEARDRIQQAVYQFSGNQQGSAAALDTPVNQLPELEITLPAAPVLTPR